MFRKKLVQLNFFVFGASFFAGAYFGKFFLGGFSSSEQVNLSGITSHRKVAATTAAASGLATIWLQNSRGVSRGGNFPLAGHNKSQSRDF